MKSIQQQAREWAEREGYTIPPYTAEEELAAVYGYLAGYAARGEWISVENYDGEVSELKGTFHFLFSTYSAGAKKFLEWGIVTGSIGDGGDIVDTDDMFTDFHANDVEYFMPLAELPSPPNQEI